MFHIPSILFTKKWRHLPFTLWILCRQVQNKLEKCRRRLLSTLQFLFFSVLSKTIQTFSWSLIRCCYLLSIFCAHLNHIFVFTFQSDSPFMAWWKKKGTCLNRIRKLLHFRWMRNDSCLRLNEATWLAVIGKYLSFQVTNFLLQKLLKSFRSWSWLSNKRHLVR